MAAPAQHFAVNGTASQNYKNPGMAYQRSRRSLRELCGVTADPSRAGDRTLSPASSRMPVETTSQRDPAAAPEERGVVILAGSVSMKFGE